MTKKSKLLSALTFIILVSLILGGTYFYHQNFVTGVWRYKMTVVVDTPEGIKAGSAVREVRNSASRIDIGGTPESTNPAMGVGEAVIVDLGKRGKLFALMSGGRGGPTSHTRILYYTFGGGTSFGGIRALNHEARVGRLEVLKHQDYPTLVRFKNPDDPMSVEAVDYRNLSKSFGQDVRLKEITIEIVDEPVTWGNVDKALPSSFEEKIIKNWRNLPSKEKTRLMSLTTFKSGDRP